MVVRACRFVACALEEVVVAGFLAVEAHVVGYPCFLAGRWDGDVEAVIGFVEGNEAGDGVGGEEGGYV